MICYINPDGSHVRGCDRHVGKHPYDWCGKQFKIHSDRIRDLDKELQHLIKIDPASEHEHELRQ